MVTSQHSVFIYSSTIGGSSGKFEESEMLRSGNFIYMSH